MDKKTKQYLGIGAAIVVVYLIWQNRSKFGTSASIETPIGGVSARIGQGGASISTSAPMSAPMNVTMNEGSLI